MDHGLKHSAVSESFELLCTKVQQKSFTADTDGRLKNANMAHFFKYKRTGDGWVHRKRKYSEND